MIGIKSAYYKVLYNGEEINYKPTYALYRYGQNTEDFCELKFATGYRKIADEPFFQEGTKLTYEWGYLDYLGTPKLYAKRDVWIRDVKNNYSESIVTLTLICGPKGGRLKNNADNKIHKNTDVNKVAQEIADKNGLKFSGVDKSDTGDNQEITRGLQSPGYLSDDLLYKTPVDQTSVPRQFNYKKYDEYPQGNKSDYGLMKDMLDSEPGGPFELINRDDELVIRKYPFGRKPIKTYTYGESRELVLFNPTEKSKTRKHGSVNQTMYGFDPYDKKAFAAWGNNTNTQLKFLGEKTNAPSPDVNPSNDAASENVADIKNPTNINVSTDSNNIEGEASKSDKLAITSKFQGKLETLEVGGNPQYEKINTSSPTFFQDGNITTAVDATATTLKYKNFFRYNKTVPSVEQTPEEVFNQASNAQGEDSIQITPGVLELEGDPGIKSGEIITILGCAKKHAGNYYILEAEHEISPRGSYRLTCKITRNAEGNNQNNSASKKKVQTINKTGKVNDVQGPKQDIGNSLLKTIKQLNATEGVPIVPNPTLQ